MQNIINNLKWEKASRNYHATAVVDGFKYYFKTGYYSKKKKSFFGNECVNEVIVSRLLNILGIEHVSYEIVFGNINIENEIYKTQVVWCKDFCRVDETKIPINKYYENYAFKNESRIDFCKRIGIWEEIQKMIIVDYLIMNRDRQSNNIFLLKNKYNKEIRLAPLFDHGLSLLYNCWNKTEVENFKVLEDEISQLYIGDYKVSSGLSYLDTSKQFSIGELKISDKQKLIDNLDCYIPKYTLDKTWLMLWQRWCLLKQK